MLGRIKIWYLKKGHGKILTNFIYKVQTQEKFWKIEISAL